MSSSPVNKDISRWLSDLFSYSPASPSSPARAPESSAEGLWGLNSPTLEQDMRDLAARFQDFSTSQYGIVPSGERKVREPEPKKEQPKAPSAPRSSAPSASPASPPSRESIEAQQKILQLQKEVLQLRLQLGEKDREIQQIQATPTKTEDNAIYGILLQDLLKREHTLEEQISTTNLDLKSLPTVFGSNSAKPPGWTDPQWKEQQKKDRITDKTRHALSNRLKTLNTQLTDLCREKEALIRKTGCVPSPFKD